ncbi:MAG: DUF4190 domain-containing protein [Spirochaetales bacterium]|nr:DUF4190 domain-containing protein [Spirochaetales bacterium]MCF7937819.1 DUF4190 domain-containing protein [Spirochaetales bacterium]
MATAALVLGIVGVVFSWVPILNFILGALAIILGALGMKKTPEKKGMAIAGLVLGIVTVVVGIIVVAVAGAAASALLS